MKKIIVTTFCAFAFVFSALAGGGEKPKKEKPNNLHVSGYAKSYTEGDRKITVDCEGKEGTCVAQVGNPRSGRIDLFDRQGRVKASFEYTTEVVTNSRQGSTEDSEIVEITGDLIRIQ